MALEAVVFSKGFFGRCAMAAEGVGGGGGVWGGNGHGHGGGMELDGSNAHCGAAVASTEAPEGSSSLPALPPPGHGSDPGGADDGAVDAASASGAAGRRKRRRARSVKNIEEAESQRMTHIAVERNRRKQMNEYLGVLRSLMPASYVHRVRIP
uniref:BHLH domain-containing protein n=1 Tax=Aegilops tauschii subsp. strangulata TaxID=200361 RepID=A0A453PRA9_AEGTS